MPDSSTVVSVLLMSVYINSGGEGEGGGAWGWGWGG